MAIGLVLLERNSVVAFFAPTAADGKTYQIECFDLDAVLFVGYRVNSVRGTQFRTWMTGMPDRQATVSKMETIQREDPHGLKPVLRCWKSAAFIRVDRRSRCLCGLPPPPQGQAVASVVKKGKNFRRFFLVLVGQGVAAGARDIFLWTRGVR
jgi:hypothetical protein